MANTHAFFGGLLVSDAADWVHSYYTETDVPILAAAPNAPTGYIAETGWPTGSMTAENATYQGAVASVANLQVFLDDYVCAANTNGSQYFYFSPFAEPWKEQFGGVEPYWGLHDSNKVSLTSQNVRQSTELTPYSESTATARDDPRLHLALIYTCTIRRLTLFLAIRRTLSPCSL